ncbi:MAG: hypothetical protein ACK5LO_10115 [Leucobacter sp.]
MARRIIHIEPTVQQWAVIDELSGPSPVVTTGEDGAVVLIRIIDDQDVLIYDIAPDGSYTYEELEDFGCGWTRFTAGGEVIAPE